jgi:IPT/TIG domain
VRGKNFIEFGFGKAKCVFNNTYYTNATVTDPNTLYCDSPPLDSLSGDTWYNVSVSLDGDQVSNST